MSLLTEAIDEKSIKKVISGKDKKLVLSVSNQIINAIVDEFYDYYHNECEEEYASSKDVIVKHIEVKKASMSRFTTEKGEFIHLHINVDMDKEFLKNISDKHIPSVDFMLKIEDGAITKVRHEIYFDG